MSSLKQRTFRWFANPSELVCRPHSAAVAARVVAEELLQAANLLGASLLDASLLGANLLDASHPGADRLRGSRRRSGRPPGRRKRRPQLPSPSWHRGPLFGPLTKRPLHHRRRASWSPTRSRRPPSGIDPRKSLFSRRPLRAAPLRRPPSPRTGIRRGSQQRSIRRFAFGTCQHSLQ